MTCMQWVLGKTAQTAYSRGLKLKQEAVYHRRPCREESQRVPHVETLPIVGCVLLDADAVADVCEERSREAGTRITVYDYFSSTKTPLFSCVQL